MQGITPCLWFDSDAEEAVNFYISIFKNSKIVHIAHYGDSSAKASGRPKESVMTVAFEIQGQDFVALNGGPVFSFSPAISFFANCETQDEIDELWARLSEGGAVHECGWVTDKFGVTWQVVPAILGEMMRGKNARKSENVMNALMKMTKIDLETLKKAYEEG